MIFPLDIAPLWWSEGLVGLPAAVAWIFVSLTLGLAMVWVVMETAARLTADGLWAQWAQGLRRPMLMAGSMALMGLLLTMGAGVFNWAGLWQRVPWLAQPPLLITEGVVSLLLALWLWMALRSGRRQASEGGHHLLYVWLAAIFMGLALWCPVAVLAWLEVPVSARPAIATGALDVAFLPAVLLSSWAVLKFFHIMLCSWVVGAMVVLGIGQRMALLRGMDGRPQKYLMWTGVVMGLLCLFGVMCTGDSTGYGVTHNQPAKMAVMQGVEQGGREVPFTLVGSLKIPKMLSRLGTHSNRGYVAGRQDILAGYGQEPSVAQKRQQGQAARQSQLRWHKAALRGDRQEMQRQEQLWSSQSQYLGYTLLEDAADALPQQEGVLFWSFRLMVGLGLGLFVLLGLQIFLLVKPQSRHRRAILYMGLLGLPAAWLCTLCGWLIAEVGRGAWMVTGLLPSWLAVSQLPQAWVLAEAGAMLVACLVLLLAGWRMVMGHLHGTFLDN